MNPGNVNILDCTLRDGSYLIDYQFTAEDTYLVCLGLRRAGFRYVEIGHGTGLGSSQLGNSRAAASDEAYLQAAASALEGSGTEFGMFFIPGIGRMEDLELAADTGMSFVRIGTNAEEVASSRRFVEKARSLGLFVFSNLMKSYSVSPKRLAAMAAKAVAYGSEAIYVVDSAGCMLPQDIGTYVKALRNATGKAIGFHGHNNLQMAVANTLEAVRSGATFIDSSLQGMGRSAGNAQTEVLVAIMERLGFRTHIDLLRAMDVGHRVVRSMMSRDQGVDDISIISGLARFHSGFMDQVDAVAEEYGVDPRLLIMEISRKDCVHVTKEDIGHEAARISRRLKRKASGDSRKKEVAVSVRRLSVQRDIISVTAEIVGLTKKRGLESVFSFTLSGANRTVYPYVRASRSLVIGNCEASGVPELRKLLAFADGKVDWILLDADAAGLIQAGLDRLIKQSRAVWYSEERLLALSVSSLLSGMMRNGKVLVLASADQSDLVGRMLKPRCIEVVADIQRIGEVDGVVSFGRTYAEGLSETYLRRLPKRASVIAAVPSAFPDGFWRSAIAEKRKVCRVDTRAGLVAEATLAVESARLISSMGSRRLGNLVIVSGGVIGGRGSIVVDSTAQPSRVIGIADGWGGLLPTGEEGAFAVSLGRMRDYIVNRTYSR